MNMHERRLAAAVAHDAQHALDLEAQQLVREERMEELRAMERGRLQVKRELRRQGVPDTAFWAGLPRTRVPDRPPAPEPMNPVLLNVLIFAAVSVAAWFFGEAVGGMVRSLVHHLKF